MMADLCVWACFLLLPGICLSEEVRRLRIERTSVRLSWSQTLLLSPVQSSHTHTGDSTQVRLIFQPCVSARVRQRVCASSVAQVWDRRARAYDSSVSGAAASQARFILFRNVLADCSVAPSPNRCEARRTHSRRRTREDGGSQYIKLMTFICPALNGFYNVA